MSNVFMMAIKNAGSAKILNNWDAKLHNGEAYSYICSNDISVVSSYIRRLEATVDALLSERDD